MEDDSLYFRPVGPVISLGEVTYTWTEWTVIGANGKEYDLCKRCPVHHITNCGTCFGFGVKPGPANAPPIPVIAGAAIDGRVTVSVACPECGSTIQGYKGE